jgi:site-specific recombinase XerD
MYDTDKQLAASTLYKQVIALGERAGIAVRVTPHAMRHCFATYVARHTGIQTAQALLGHADISTTQRYAAGPTLDELAVSLHGFSFYSTSPLPMQPGKEANPR